MAGLVRQHRILSCKDHYSVEMGPTSVYAGGYTWFELSNISQWQRVWGNTAASTDINNMERVFWERTRIMMRYEVWEATAGRHCANCFLIALTRMGQVRFPNGAPGSVLTDNQDYIRNTYQDQVMLNTDYFKVLKTWKWELASRVQSGSVATQPTVVDPNSYYKAKTVAMYPRLLLNHTNAGWRSLQTMDLPASKQYTLLVFHSLTTDNPVPGATIAPRMVVTQLNTIKRAT